MLGWEGCFPVFLSNEEELKRYKALVLSSFFLCLVFALM